MISFADFERDVLKKLRINYESITLTDAVKIITCHRVEILKQEDAPVFVFIDEFRHLAKVCADPIKADKLENDVLSSVGQALRESDRLTVLISTLDHTPMLRAGIMFFNMSLTQCDVKPGLILVIFSLLLFRSESSECIWSSRQVYCTPTVIGFGCICRYEAV